MGHLGGGGWISICLWHGVETRQLCVDCLRWILKRRLWVLMAGPKKCLLSWAATPFAPPQEAQTLYLIRCCGWIPSPVISCTSDNWFKPLTFAKQNIVLSSGNARNSKLCLTSPFGCHDLPLDPRAAAGITLCWFSTVQEHQAGESIHSKVLVCGEAHPQYCEHTKLFCTTLV